MSAAAAPLRAWELPGGNRSALGTSTQFPAKQRPSPESRRMSVPWGRLAWTLSIPTPVSTAAIGADSTPTERVPR